MYLLDTNICIYLIKQHSKELLKNIQRRRVTEVAISSITLAELRYGVEKSHFPEKNSQALDLFLLPFEVLSFDALAASAYGRIRASLEKSGKLIGSLDMLIAAHAISSGSVLVTNNQREFLRVKGLQVEDWTI